MTRYECDRCGACCKFPIIEVTELDVHREPLLKTAAAPCKGFPGAVYQDEDGNDATPLEPDWVFGGILACGPSRPCPLLSPDNLCSIYKSRPNCCVGFQAGSDLCQESRAGHGLPPLVPCGEALTS